MRSPMLSKMASGPTMGKSKPDYSNYRKYVESEAEAGRLKTLAARAMLGLDELQQVLEGAPITDDVAYHLSLATQPQDDRWCLDPEDPDFEKVPDLDSEQIRDRLKFAQSEGVLGVIAHVSGVKGGLATLEHFITHGGKLDPVTRMQLLNVMTEEDPNEP